MIELLSNLGSAFGLSASAGLNAYLPLLIVALTARFTPLIRLRPPFSTLTNGWVILVIAILLIVEIVTDKIPVVDTVNDSIQTFVRPAAGAILFATATNTIVEIHPVLAMVCGVIVAGGVHAVKATARPVITASTGGLGNSVVSAVEDIASGATSVLALILPLLAAGLVLLLLILVIWRLVRRRAPRKA